MGNSWSDAQIMMTLSGIAYYSDVNGQLKNPTYATENDWSVVWGPVTDWYGNRAYVARSASTGKYAVAIRGTETEFGWDALVNMYEDLNVLWQSPWDYFFASPGPMISRGAYTQVCYLLYDDTFGGLTLSDFLAGIPAEAPVAVTGHSLGGNLATVLGSFVSFVRGPQENAQDLVTEVYSFAAPSPGNQAFTDAYNARLTKSFRYWNARDIVPCAWDRVPDLYTIYDSVGIPTPYGLQTAIYAMYRALVTSEAWYNSYYKQTNGDGNKLSSELLPLTTDWTSEAIYQHGVNTYLGLLNAPPIQSSATLALDGLQATGSTIPRIPIAGAFDEKAPPNLAAQISSFNMKSSRVARVRGEFR